MGPLFVLLVLLVWLVLKSELLRFSIGLANCILSYLRLSEALAVGECAYRASFCTEKRPAACRYVFIPWFYFSYSVFSADDGWKAVESTRFTDSMARSL